MSLRMWEMILSLTFTSSSWWILASLTHCLYRTSASITFRRQRAELRAAVQSQICVTFRNIYINTLWPPYTVGQHSIECIDIVHLVVIHLGLGFVLGLPPLIQCFGSSCVVHSFSRDSLSLFQLITSLEVLLPSLFKSCHCFILKTQKGNKRGKNGLLWF